MQTPHRTRVRRRGIASTVLVLAATGALIGCAAQDPDGTPTADCEVRVLIVAGVTGASATNGEAVAASTKVAAERINDEGGVNGCELVLDVKDTGSDNTKALPLTQEAIAQQEYAMVMGADFGATNIVPYLTRQGILQMTQVGVKGLPDPETNPYLFDTNIASADVITALAEYVVDETEATKIAVVVDTTAVGGSVVDAVTSVAQEAGVEVTAERVELTSVNMTPAVQRAQASGADALIVNLFGAAGGYFFRDLAASAWDVPVYGGQSVFATDLASVLPIESVRNVVVAGAALGTEPSISPAVDDLIAQLKADGDPVDKPLQVYAAAHDGLVLWAWAANGAGSTEAADVADYLEQHGDDQVPNLTYSTTSNYSATNHEWHPKDGIGLANVSELVDGRYDNRIAVKDA